MVERFDQKYIPLLDPPENTALLKKYVRHCELQRCSLNTIKNKVRRIVPFCKWCGQDITMVQAETIEDYFLERSETLSPRTIDGDVIEFRVFYKWLHGEETAKTLLKNINKSRRKNELPVELILNYSDIKSLVSVAGEKQRDRAIVMLIWDSGARINEMMNLNIANILFDEHGAVCVVNGKTGKRRLRLTVSVPDLQLWIEHHPYRETPDAPLFITSRSFSKKNKPKRLTEKTVETLMTRLKTDAGIHKPCNPHAVRHARMTDFARLGFTEMELRIVGGWSKSSNMPAVYIHLSGADVEKKVLQAAGLIQDEIKKEDEFKPQECPRCKSLNSHDSKICKTCGLILDPVMAVRMKIREDEIQENTIAMIKRLEILEQKLSSKN